VKYQMPCNSLPQSLISILEMLNITLIIRGIRSKSKTTKTIPKMSMMEVPELMSLALSGVGSRTQFDGNCNGGTMEMMMNM